MGCVTHEEETNSVYLKLNSDRYNSGPNPHPIPKVPFTVSSPHILRLSAIIRLQNLRTEVKCLYNGKFSLILIKHRGMNTDSGEDVGLNTFVTSVVIGRTRTLFHQVRYPFLIYGTRKVAVIDPIVQQTDPKQISTGVSLQNVNCDNPFYESGDKIRV
jgi:hypothetical protein